MHPEPCVKQMSPCPAVQMSMRVAGRLMQLERLERAASEVHLQGNKASLPIDLIDLFRRYEQVAHFYLAKLASLIVFLGWHALPSASSLQRRRRQFIRSVFINAVFFHAQLLATHA